MLHAHAMLLWCCRMCSSAIAMLTMRQGLVSAWWGGGLLQAGASVGMINEGISTGASLSKVGRLQACSYVLLLCRLDGLC